MSATSPLDHHFLEGRQYRADELGEIASQRNWWRVLALAQVVVLLGAISGLVYVGMQPSLVPYIVQWDRSSGELSPLVAAPRLQEEPKILQWMLREFVIALRSISTDKEVVRKVWDTTWSRVTTEGKARLVAYAEERKPLESQDPVSVEVLTVLPISGRTWQVQWVETTYSQAGGQLLQTRKGVGSFTYTLRQPRTRKEVLHNPAGVFLHEWQWSLDS